MKTNALFAGMTAGWYYRGLYRSARYGPRLFWGQE